MRKNDNNKNKQGSLLVEFALLIPMVLIPLMVGIWDVSTFIDINQVLTRAARDGVVMASRGSDPTYPVQQYIETAGLSAENLTVTVAEKEEAAGYGQEISITLNYDLSGITVLPWSDFLPDGVTSIAYAKME